MRSTNTLPFILFVLLFSLLTSAKPLNVIPCEVSGFIVDRDPKGLNIRQTPHSSSHVLTQIKAHKREVFVTLSGSYKGWLRLKEARDEEGTLLYQGKGWVFAPLIGTALKTKRLRKVPEYRAKKYPLLIKSPGVSLQGCQGQWIRIIHQKQNLWLAPEDHCPNPLTSCS